MTPARARLADFLLLMLVLPLLLLVVAAGMMLVDGVIDLF